jgi:hypothetical protein
MSLIIRGRTTIAGATTLGWSPAALAESNKDAFQ